MREMRQDVGLLAATTTETRISQAEVSRPSAEKIVCGNHLFTNNGNAVSNALGGTCEEAINEIMN